jgi:hypothetical protein
MEKQESQNWMTRFLVNSVSSLAHQKKWSLNIDGTERVRYDKIDCSLLKGAFIQLFQWKEDERC